MTTRWTVDRTLGVVIDEQGRIIFDIPLDGDSNAAQIVRDHNEGAGLIEALTEIIHEYEQVMLSEFETSRNRFPYKTLTWEKAQAALRLAKGEQAMRQTPKDLKHEVMRDALETTLSYLTSTDGLGPSDYKRWQETVTTALRLTGKNSLKHFHDDDEVRGYIESEIIESMTSDLDRMNREDREHYTDEDRAAMRDKLKDVRKYILEKGA